MGNNEMTQRFMARTHYVAGNLKNTTSDGILDCLNLGWMIRDF